MLQIFSCYSLTKGSHKQSESQKTVSIISWGYTKILPSVSMLLKLTVKLMGQAAAF